MILVAAAPIYKKPRNGLTGNLHVLEEGLRRTIAYFAGELEPFRQTGGIFVGQESFAKIDDAS
jgi:hypothetical protein